MELLVDDPCDAVYNHNGSTTTIVYRLRLHFRTPFSEYTGGGGGGGALRARHTYVTHPRDSNHGRPLVITPVPTIHVTIKQQDQDNLFIFSCSSLRLALAESLAVASNLVPGGVGVFMPLCDDTASRVNFDSVFLVLRAPIR